MHLSCEVVETSQSTPGENKGYIRAILLPTVDLCRCCVVFTRPFLEFLFFFLFSEFHLLSCLHALDCCLLWHVSLILKALKPSNFFQEPK